MMKRSHCLCQNWGNGYKRELAVLVVAAFSSLVFMEQSQVQLYIDVCHS